MNQDEQQKTLEYIDALEKTNTQLIISLKMCVELLSSLPPEVPDQQKWQNMLKEFKKIIKVGERIVGEKTLH